MGSALTNLLTAAGLWLCGCESAESVLSVITHEKTRSLVFFPIPRAIFRVSHHHRETSSFLWLDPMIMKVFSNLNHFVILVLPKWFCRTAELHWDGDVFSMAFHGSGELDSLPASSSLSASLKHQTQCPGCEVHVLAGLIPQ